MRAGVPLLLCLMVARAVVSRAEQCLQVDNAHEAGTQTILGGRIGGGTHSDAVLRSTAGSQPHTGDLRRGQLHLAWYPESPWGPVWSLMEHINKFACDACLREHFSMGPELRFQRLQRLEMQLKRMMRCVYKHQIHLTVR